MDDSVSDAVSTLFTPLSKTKNSETSRHVCNSFGSDVIVAKHVDTDVLVHKNHFDKNDDDKRRCNRYARRQAPWVCNVCRIVPADE